MPINSRYVDWKGLAEKMGWQSEKQMHIYYLIRQNNSLSQVRDIYSPNANKSISKGALTNRLNKLGVPLHSQGWREGMPTEEHHKEYLQANERYKQLAEWPRECFVNNHHRSCLVPEYRVI